MNTERKRLYLQKCAVALGALTLLAVTGCKKQEAPAPGQLVKPAVPILAPGVSAERTSFAEVTARLDAGGSLYLYLSTEQWLAGLSGKVAAWRGLIEAVPALKEEDRQNLGKALDLATNLIQRSGVEEVSGVGMSSIARETNFYHSKVFLHHYVGKGSGFLWNMFGQKPHALGGLDLLPATTALAGFTDLDAPMLWSVLQKQVAQGGLPQAEAALKEFPGKFELLTGLKWDRMLASLGGEFGFAVMLDDTKVVAMPATGGGDPVQIPEPGLLLVARVKDDTVFNRIAEALRINAGRQVVVGDKPGLKMRTWPLPLALPIQLRPTVAAADGYLFIATSDALIYEVLAAKSGQKAGLKSTQEFQRLAQEAPTQGNGFAFNSARFGQAMRKIQQAALQAQGGASASQLAWLQSLIGYGTPLVSYAVAANTEEGWLGVANGNQHPGRLLAVGGVVPMGIVSAIAIPNFVKARQTSQQNACISNLRLIDGAKKQWALEMKKTDSDIPARADVEPYLRKNQLPPCPAGGTYTLNRVGVLPECSVAGHGLGQ